MPLTGNQKRHLRGLGHHLDPVVLLGKEGLSDAVLAKIGVELENHELIKVKAPGEDAVALAERCRAELVQRIGHVVLLYRRRSKDPEIVLPKP